ncbi:cupin [Sphingomonas metalli]|uniref:Cupin n=1 Tax=Sphingomonas metalli TaxID=1779358 RepID=A0A916TDK4_9SPHN|nr:cupin-like domain-containing protein [Sphingomonas metalli]GGB40921.1 cupin [Sphingomonas metalli]
MAEMDAGIFAALSRVEVVTVADAADLDARLRAATRPFIVRGLVADWPLVRAGRRSAQAARDYLLALRRDIPFTVSIGTPDSDGRLFYDAGMALNFATVQSRLPDIFAQIAAQEEGTATSRPVYIGAVDMKTPFCGLQDANALDLGDRTPIASIWIGTRSRIAAHNDVPDNLACVAVGRRRFTLFPPDQFANLYLGPIDHTPAGRAISMVDFHRPDFAAHPRFCTALGHGLVAELEAGDALHIPALWWHHVEGLDAFNVLVNYWWRETPRWLGQPQDALNHAILSVRDLPAGQKAYWRAMFDHYVFENGPDTVGHIPEQARSILSPLTAEAAGRLRAFLLRALGR